MGIFQKRLAPGAAKYDGHVITYLQVILSRWPGGCHYGDESRWAPIVGLLVYTICMHMQCIRAHDGYNKFETLTANYNDSSYIQNHGYMIFMQPIWKWTLFRFLHGRIIDWKKHHHHHHLQVFSFYVLYYHMKEGPIHPQGRAGRSLLLVLWS